MRIRRLAPIFAALGTAWPASAFAQADVARADTLFDEARALRDKGNFAEACPKFAESLRLAPGIGVTLHLADCYEKLGKTKSAWTEFRNAEKLAREHDDKRADGAAGRAEALEPKLNHLTLAAAALAPGQAAPDVILDGEVLTADRLNTALPVDPGDHEVKIEAPGKVSQSLTVHIDAAVLATTVAIAAPVTDVVVVVPPAPVAPMAPPAPAPAVTASVDDPGATRRWIGYTLFAPGAAGIAIGAWLLTSKVQTYMVDGQPCDTRLRSNAVPGAVIAFAAGGLAIAGGVTLVLTAPKHRELALGPIALPGGGGAELFAAF